MPKTKPLSTGTAFLLGMIVFLFISYGFDRIRNFISDYSITHYENLPLDGVFLVFVYPTVTLFIGAVSLLTFWLIENKFQQKKWVGLIYLFIGLLIATFYSISRMYKSPGSMPDLLEQTFWPLSYLHIAGSSVAAIGFLMVILPKNKNVQKSKSLIFDISLLVGLPIFLYICRNLDVALFHVPPYMTNHKILFWLYPAALLFIETAMLFLFWFITNKLHPQKWRIILFLIIGLFITYAYSLLHMKIIQGLLPQYISNSRISTVNFLKVVFWPNYYFHIAGTLIAVTGLLSLVLPEKINQ